MPKGGINAYTSWSKSMAWRYEANPLIVGPHFAATQDGSQQAGKWLAGIWRKYRDDKLKGWDGMTENERRNVLRGMDLSSASVPLPLWIRGDERPVNANGEPFDEYAVYDDNGDQAIGERRYAHVKGAKRGRKPGFKVAPKAKDILDHQQMDPEPTNAALAANLSFNDPF